MGKRLIINGANFYANRIEDVILTPVDITDLFVLTRGRLPWRNEQLANSRAGNILANGVDISTYLAYGYSKIKITRLSQSWVVKANQNNTTIQNDMNDCVYAPDPTGGSWATTDYQGTLNANYPFLYVGLLGSSDFPETINLSDYLKIELLPALQSDTMDITGLLPNLSPGHICNVTVDGSITTNANATCLSSNFDISSLISGYGFDHIRVESLISADAVPCVIGDTSSAQSWSATSWPLGNHTQINVNIHTPTPGSTNPSDVIKVILYKE